MKVLELIHFNDYFTDPKFQRKKPLMTGTWRQRCGDYIYWQDGDDWCQLVSPYHYSKKDLRKDTKHPYALVSKHFYYFGNVAIQIPKQFDSLVWKKQGCKFDHNVTTVNNFLEWLDKTKSSGRHGEPIDAEIDSKYCSS